MLPWGSAKTLFSLFDERVSIRGVSFLGAACVTGCATGGVLGLVVCGDSGCRGTRGVSFFGTDGVAGCGTGLVARGVSDCRGTRGISALGTDCAAGCVTGLDV